MLKDAEKRAAYDQLGANWKQGQEFRPPPDWNTGFEFEGGGFTGGDSSEFSDFFESLFGRGGFGTGAVAAGGGSFHAQGQDRHARVLIDLEDAYNGATRTITLRVPDVDAQGRVFTREHTLNVTIPKGIRAGQHLRSGGPGHARRRPGQGGRPVPGSGVPASIRTTASKNATCISTFRSRRGKRRSARR